MDDFTALCLDKTAHDINGSVVSIEQGGRCNKTQWRIKYGFIDVTDIGIGLAHRAFLVLLTHRITRYLVLVPRLNGIYLQHSEDHSS